MAKERFDSKYLKISRFSELVDVPASTLRHYENVGAFCPTCRSEGLDSGDRLYSPTQITTVKMVQAWVKAGASLETISELMKNRSPESTLFALQACDEELEKQEQSIKKSRQFVAMKRGMLEEALNANESEITISKMPESLIILGGDNDFRGTTGYVRELANFYKSQCGSESDSAHPVGGYFNCMDTFTNEPSQPDRFFFIDPAGCDCKKAGLYMTGYSRGDYGQAGDLPERMRKYALKNGYLFNGPVYNIYLVDEASTIDPSKYLLQVCASVEKNKRSFISRMRHWNNNTVQH